MRNFKNFCLLPVSKNSLKKALRGALIACTPEAYSIIVYVSAAIGFILGLYIVSLFKVNTFVAIFLSLMFYTFTLAYPFAVARSRRTGIDMKLPHAITYMRSLCGVMPLYDVFKQIFTEKDLYGEVSEEFGFILRDVELLGMSLNEAMLNLAFDTPSENLKEFLQGLAIVFESGGDMRGYMSAKAENFRDRARKQLEINMRTLEMLAEVFAVLFVALPVFLIIVISTAHFLGRGVSRLFYLYLYFFIPVGGTMIIYVIDLINIKEELSVTKTIVGLDLMREFKPEFERVKVYTPIKERFKNAILKPFIASKENYYYSLLFSPIFAALWYFVVKNTNFRFFETKISLLIILTLVPLSIAFEYRAAFVRAVEKETPDFLRQILNLKNIGLTLHDVVGMLKESKLGVLSREVSFTHADIEWGLSVRDALIELINRVGVSSIRRAITLLLRASEVTENVRDVLLTAIEDFEYELKLKDLRFATGFAYISIIYLSFFILLYISYSIIHAFLSKLPNYTPSQSLLSMMYQIAITLSVFSGIVAGQMEKGHVLHGLKHTFIFLIASIIVFEFLIPGLRV
jgi:flagellar protein FlaJ